SATPDIAAPCSPSSTIATSPRTTIYPSEPCAPPRPIAKSPAASARAGRPTSTPASDPPSQPQPETASTPSPPSRTSSPQPHPQLGGEQLRESTVIHAALSSDKRRIGL